MFDSEQIIRFKRLERWFETPLGQRVAHVFSDALSHFEYIPRGDMLLQLGACGANLWLKHLAYTHQLIIASHNSFTQRADCYALCHKLPLDRNSIDCVVAPLTIHAYSHDDNLLDEIDRVLKPMGYVIFFGINPLSVWGLWLKMSKNACFGRSHGYEHSLLSLKHAMQIRDYTLLDACAFYYIPPLSRPYWLDKMQFLNQIGYMIAPMPSAFYCLVMQKKVADYLLVQKPLLTPICSGLS